MSRSSLKKVTVTKLQAIVFDLDDTLYPERDFVLSGFQKVAAWCEMYLEIPADEAFSELKCLFTKGVRGDTFNQWLQSHGQEDSDHIVPKLVQVYREHTPALSPFPEVPDLLVGLRMRYLLGLLSDGYLPVQRRKLDALGLGAHFDAVIFTDEWGREAWKPSPMGFRILLERLGIKGTEAVYVADNPYKDFVGAHKAGMWTVRVRRADGLHAKLEPVCADYAPNAEIGSLHHLEAVLLEAISCRT